MSAEEDTRARREAWVAAGASDYAAPTYDSGGNINGYQSVASQPMNQRSESNQSLVIVNGLVVDTKTGQRQDPPPQPAPQTPSAPQQQQPADSGDAVAIDGQTFKGQSTQIQQMFIGTWGAATAAQHWKAEHDASVLRDQINVTQGGTPTTKTGTSTGGSGGTGIPISYNPDGTAVIAASTADKLTAWVNKNPLMALAAAGVAGSMLLGGRRR